MKRKIADIHGGINRATALLLVLIAVLVILIGVPGYRAYRYRAQKVGCQQAMKSAKDGLIIDFLSNWKEVSAEEAMQTLDQVLPERPNICPAGGTVYLVRNSLGIFEPVCGLHESDGKLKVRLNASRAMELVAEALRKARETSEEEPESAAITLNGRELECVRVHEKLDLRRGTATTNGYKGIVAFYALEGDGMTTGRVKDGEICYFVYADEDHAAVWRADDGWTGDGYMGI